MRTQTKSGSTATGRWRGLLLLLCVTAGAAHAAAPRAAAPVKVEYAEATDAFNVLDNLADWLPGYTASAYGEYWEKHIGLDAADRAVLAAYAAFRQRTAEAARENGRNDPEPNDLFAPAATRKGDSFARHFLEASSFESGVASAIAAQAPKDRDMLRAYYARFGARALHLVRTQSHFDSQRKALTAQLASPAVPVLASALRDFYLVGPAPTFIARLVWWPDPDSTQAKVRGRYILLHSQADGGAAEPMDWAPIVLHEYAHYLSAGQSAAQKQRLTAAFLQRCPAAAKLPNPLNAFEEPLAIYWGQYRFEHVVRGRELSAVSDWYFKPVADRIAKAIAAAFPASGPPPKLEDPALLAAAGAACADAQA